MTWISAAPMAGASASTPQSIVFSAPVGMPPSSWIVGPRERTPAGSLKRTDHLTRRPCRCCGSSSSAFPDARRAGSRASVSGVARPGASAAGGSRFSGCGSVRPDRRSPADCRWPWPARSAGQRLRWPLTSSVRAEPSHWAVSRYHWPGTTRCSEETRGSQPSRFTKKAKHPPSFAELRRSWYSPFLTAM